MFTENFTFCTRCAEKLGIRVVEGKDGIFVSMPQSTYKDKQSGKTMFKDAVHPDNKELRLAVVEAVKAKYNNEGTAAPSTPEAQAEADATADAEPVGDEDVPF